MAAATSVAALTDAPARPFLKWAGGKSRLVPEILARFPLRFGRYHEPFLGGGAVFFALQPERAALSDINEELIHTYTVVRDQTAALIEALERMRVNKTEYYRVRALRAETLSDVQRAARTIYLNRTCFNGLYRVNRSGQFNVPYGRHTNPTICHADNLAAVARALRSVDLGVRSALAVVDRARPGDLVYFDPPYDPLSPTASFTSYARDGFGRAEQEALRDAFEALVRRRVHVLLSNSDTPFIRELYADFRIDQVFARRAINARGDGRGVVAEVLVRGR